MRTEGTAFVVLNRSLDAKAHLYHPDKPGRTLCGIKLKATERQRMGETVCRRCMRVEDWERADALVITTVQPLDIVGKAGILPHDVSFLHSFRIR